MTDIVELNQVGSRQLRNGDWILLTGANQPIVVNDATKTSLMASKIDLDLYDTDFKLTLQQNGFLKNVNQFKIIPEQLTTICILCRKTLLYLGVISSVGVIFLMFIIGIPFGNKLISSNIQIAENLIFIVFVSILTTILHEIMHIIFSQNFDKVKLITSFKMATAKVSLSNIWIWSRLGRVSAVSAGMILDTLLLLILSYAQLFVNNWMLSVTSSVLLVRILWQFRFHKRCDGQLLVAMLIDDPFLNERMIGSTHTFGTQFLKVIGHLTSLLILLGWGIPFVLAIFLKIW
ncbi:hypothetical protein [Lentilactobacillus fungorum]|uniref:hypothetical protein n=1 Tax=Lentilactobacillus fungorum TaxID=2201250 RepID=UPI0019431545|nr:hypothetical protein [Lentilactobacillus fungorum]